MSPTPSTTATPTESTPLLSSSHSSVNQSTRSRPASVYSQDDSTPKLRRQRKWASLVALISLCVVALIIMIAVFVVPDAVEKYALQAATIHLDGVVPEFTDTGARARIRGTFMMQSSKVDNANIRNIGVFGTWLARKVDTSESIVHVTLPDFHNVLLGTAVVPPIKVSIVNGQKTDFDFTADLTPPKSTEGIKSVLDQYLNRTLNHLNVQGTTDVKVCSGFISLPSQHISQILTIQNDQIPDMPRFNITRLNFHEGELPDHTAGMLADASITIQNNFPIDLKMPPLYFSLLVDNCRPHQPKIVLADAAVGNIHVLPKKDITVDAVGFVHPLPDSLTAACPTSGKSPLDTLLGGYMKGHNITVFVTGSKDQTSQAPKWMADLLSSITVPVPVPGHTFGDVIKNFTLADVKFTLPDPFADPDEPTGNPQISATIDAYIELPQEINFALDVQRVKAKADVLYKKKKMGELNLREWQPANSTLAGRDEAGHPLLRIQSDIHKAPLKVTDDDLFTNLVEALLFSGKPVILQVKADVDVEIDTTLGVLTVREIPAEGKVPVTPISIGNGFSSLNPKIRALDVIATTNNSLTLEAAVDFDNPTEYSAMIPFAVVNFFVNDTWLGHATAKSLDIVKGTNKNIKARAILDPSSSNNKTAGIVARNFISQFVSGWNTSIYVQTYEGTFPNQPALGKALSRFKLEIPTSSLHFPKNPNDGDPEDPNNPDDGDTNTGPHFISSATMHLLSSTAEFVLNSPFTATTMCITSMNATAFYKEDVVGTITYDLPLAIPPGVSTTPRLPVKWDLGSVGYEALRKALGGQLKIKAVADIGVRINKWEENIWYRGNGIGAKVRL